MTRVVQPACVDNAATKIESRCGRVTWEHEIHAVFKQLSAIRAYYALIAEGICVDLSLNGFPVRKTDRQAGQRTAREAEPKDRQRTLR